MQLIRITHLFAVFFILSPVLFSQKSSVYTDITVEYKRGLDLFRMQKYSAAQKAFFQAIADENNPVSQVSVDAQYHAALCALELFHKDAEQMLMEFIEQHPENPRVRTAYFQLGRYHFRKKQYDQVVHWLNKVDIYDLENPEIAEYYFKLGYSYFMLNDFEKAQTVFFEIKDVESPYSKPALYYYSHIQYSSKNYETALSGFLTLSDSGGFTAVVPYYITQIYYLQERYDKLLEYAPSILDTSTTTKRVAEIARLIGEAYFHKENFDAAVPYLERYQRETVKITREDQYQLGYAYYKSGNFNSAIETFKQVTREQDNLAQHAYYHMASSYLEKGKKDFARHALRAVSLLDADKKIKEDAFYHYAKLSYELDLNAIEAIGKYIAAYPGTKRADEAYAWLADLFLRTRNYRNALAAMEKIKSREGPLNNAYQKIAYSRGVELFNDRKYASAILHFDKALLYPQDKQTELYCHYWKGESWYRLHQLEKAIDCYEKFIYLPGAFNTDVFNLVYYNLGYACFDLKDYSSASSWFRKFSRNADPRDQLRKGDAWLRTADCFFAMKDFQNAIDYYDSCIALKAFDTDYALFQKAFALGVTGHKNEKIQTLLSIIDTYKNSVYLDDAKYESGEAYMEINEPAKALPMFESIIKEHGNSSYLSRAMLKTGLIHYNSEQHEKALEIFREVISRYPATNEAMEALAGCKNIYVQAGKVDEYASYVQGLSFANITRASLDSTTYEAAELRYSKGNCQEARKDFENYLQKFPDGFFALHANFYKADCEYKTGEPDKALNSYLYVSAQPKNMFTEKTLVRLSEIYFRKDDFANALVWYSRLEETGEYLQNILSAVIGQMRCHFNLNNHAMTIQYALKVLGFEKVSSDLVTEANLLMGKAALAMDDYNTAFNALTVTARSNSEMGAEAKYYAAYIQYLRGNYKQSEEIIFELANQVPSYEYWVAKGFILLADNYLMMNNAFQAKATLQSIIDNYDGKDMVEAARGKLHKIIEAEKAAAQPQKQPEEIEIKFEEQDIDYDKLFEEEKIEESE